MAEATKPFVRPWRQSASLVNVARNCPRRSSSSACATARKFWLSSGQAEPVGRAAWTMRSNNGFPVTARPSGAFRVRPDDQGWIAQPAGRADRQEALPLLGSRNASHFGSSSPATSIVLASLSTPLTLQFSSVRLACKLRANDQGGGRHCPRVFLYAGGTANRHAAQLHQEVEQNADAGACDRRITIEGIEACKDMIKSSGS